METAFRVSCLGRRSIFTAHQVSNIILPVTFQMGLLYFWSRLPSSSEPSRPQLSGTRSSLARFSTTRRS